MEAKHEVAQNEYSRHWSNVTANRSRDQEKIVSSSEYKVTNQNIHYEIKWGQNCEIISAGWCLFILSYWLVNGETATGEIKAAAQIVHSDELTAIFARLSKPKNYFYTNK